MNVMCELRGHRLPKGYGTDWRPYLKVKRAGIDGCGTEHATLWAECDRCGEDYHVANIHLPKQNETKGK